MVHPVSEELVDQFGIVDIKGVDLKEGESANLIFNRKTLQNDAPSNFSITGRYVFANTLWTKLSDTRLAAVERYNCWYGTEYAKGIANF